MLTLRFRLVTKICTRKKKKANYLSSTACLYLEYYCTLLHRVRNNIEKRHFRFQNHKFFSDILSNFRRLRYQNVFLFVYLFKK